MARNSSEVKHLFRVFGLGLKGFHRAGQAAEGGVLERTSEGFAKTVSENNWGGVGTFYKRDCRNGNRSWFSRGEQGKSRVVGYNRGLQSLSGKEGRVASYALSKASFFTASKSLSRKEALKSAFNSRRVPTDVRGWRSYHIDRNGVRHFTRRGPAAWSGRLTSRRSLGWIAVIVVVGGVVYVRNSETVPYTHRKHFLLISPELERALGDRSFKMLLQEYRDRVLPAVHPETLRVHRVAAEIIKALMLGTRTSDWGQLEKVEGDSALGPGWDTVTRNRDSRLLGATYTDPAHSHDDSIDEGWVDRSRKEGQMKGEETFLKHLEGMQWQVLVVDDDIVNAFCLPGGKIVVFTGLLKVFHTEPEIATVIGHEVGHAVARHPAESLTQNLFLVALQLAVLSVFYVPSIVNSVSELLLRLPFSRRMEIEADHIGLILMAAAGYDPRVAPGFYEKLASIEKAPEFAQYLSTHPSGKKRGQKLRETETMEEAMRLYRQRIAGRGVEGFF